MMNVWPELPPLDDDPDPFRLPPLDLDQGQYIILGDALDELRKLPDNSVDAVVTDPPANIGFMGRSWDRFEGLYDNSVFGNWLAGFTDGEGCFRIHREKGGGYYACHFTIKLRRDDRGILEQILAFMGVGRVANLEVSPSETAARVGTKPQAHYIVDTRAGCDRVREVFTAFPLRAKKAREFSLWCEALEAWKVQGRGNRWQGPSDKLSMEHFWGRLKPLREYCDEPAEVPPPDGGSGNPFIDALTTIFRECCRVLKPGGHALVWAIPRTSHWTATAIEEAGFELRDRVSHFFGSGFPKSLNLGGGIGTALKPACEDWWLARKPLVGTIATNVERYGTGGLNIDGCRIDGKKRHPGDYDDGGAVGGGRTTGAFSGSNRASFDATLGRWPANVVLSHHEDCTLVGVRSIKSDGHYPATRPSGSQISGPSGHAGQDGLPERFTDGEVVEQWECVEGCAVRALDEQTGTLSSGANNFRRRPHETIAMAGSLGEPREGVEEVSYGDRGGASRFFYVAKPSRKEREAGCEHLTVRTGAEVVGREEGSVGIQNPRAGAGRTARAIRNIHPTCKSITLMRWLLRLVTPPGGLVLDPFAGSGTTLCAAALEGFQCIGIEREPEYVEIARARLAHWQQQVAAGNGP